MSDPARNKRAGRRWESDLRNALREAGLDYEELRLTGALDEGDGVVRFKNPGERVVVEAKAGVLHAADFVRQAHRERDVYAARRNLDRGVRGVAIIKARGKGPLDAYVLTTVRDYFGLGDD